MLTLTIDNGSGPVDYTRYVVDQSVNIQDSINIPTLLNFQLANVDNSFVVPEQGAYCTLYSNAFGKNLATGFVTNAPEVAFLGMGGNIPGFGFQRMTYTVQVTSDEWLLNVKALPFIPAFVSQTQGQILAALANILAPGFFDTSQIQNSILVPYFQYDPTQKWSDLAKQFGDASRYRYKAIGRQITFAPFGDTALGVVYDDTLKDNSFDPSMLDTTILTVPPVNEAIVVGDTEPQQMHDDYFIGDGFTANFPLRHKMFNGSTNLLLEDDWTEISFNSSWTVQDPYGNYLLDSGGSAIGALNVVTSLSLTGNQLGQSYILAKNGIELGGHLTLQHGDFTFVNVNTGLIGGVFSGAQTQLNLQNCICAFQAFTSPGDVVVASPSGAQNVSLQPVFNGAAVGPVVKTQINHQYVLFTYIHARQYTRATQSYTSLVGTVFGNDDIPSLADIQFVVQDIDQTVPWNPPLTTMFTVTGANIPSFGTYALFSNQALNLNVNFTVLSQPPQATLSVVGLTGVTGSQLPIFGPDAVLTAPVQVPLGFGIGPQVATIVSTDGDADQLSFYAGQILQSYVPSIGGVAQNLVGSTIPSPGERIRMTSWESGKSLADVQDPNLVAEAAVIDGDDGRRVGVFLDLNPLPRSSADCEQAALAQIADRSGVQYQGSYTVTVSAWHDFFWSGIESDYPYTGRYLPVNSPQRNMAYQNLFVNQVGISVLEMHDEVMQFQISFGQDLYLDKLLARFIQTPTNVLEPNDTAVAPTLQYVNEVGLTFLPDLVNAQASVISGNSVTIDLGAPPITGCEVRRADYGWGTADQNLVGVFTSQVFTLPRDTYETIYYLRQVSGTQISRFTRVMRIVRPITPTAPALAGVSESDPQHPVIELAFTGDIRNIRGLEIRDYDNVTILEQQTILSIADLSFTYNNQFGLTEISAFAYFFNLSWDYSPPLPINFFIGNPMVAIGEAGPNLVSNPGFESNSLQYASLIAPQVSGAGVIISDGWYIGENDPTMVPTGTDQAVFGVLCDDDSISGDSGIARTGQHCALIRLMDNQELAAGMAYGGAIVTPFAGSDPTQGFAVRGGDFYYFGGYVRWDQNLGLTPGTGLNGSAYFFINFYDSTGVYVPLSQVITETITGPTDASWVYLDGTASVPTNAAFALFGFVAVAQNTNATPFIIGAGVLYLDARCDDVFMFKAVRGSHASYKPLSNPLTAHDTGSPATLCTVNVGAFTMQIGNTQVELFSGSVALQPYNTVEYVYYDDPSCVGGAVTYDTTVEKSTAIAGESRFFVGSISTPILGGPDTTGAGDGGTGAQTGNTLVYGFTTLTNSFANGNGSLINGANINDGDTNTFGQLSVSGNSTANNTYYEQVSLPTALYPPAYSTVLVKILFSIPLNSLNGAIGVTPRVELFIGGFCTAPFLVAYASSIGSQLLVNNIPGPGGLNITLLDGTTANVTASTQLLGNGLQLMIVSIPSNAVLSKITVFMEIATQTADTGGVLQLNWYDTTMVVLV